MSENGEVLWEDPPPRARRAGGWLEKLTPLIAAPGVWARVAERANPNAAAAIAHNLRRRSVHLPEGEWEFVSRMVDGTAYVYARYLGPKEQATS